MENLIEVKNECNNLDKLNNLLSKESAYECSKEYDVWEHRIATNGQMEQCVVLKKSNMHAIKAYFINENTLKINHIIPSKMMHAYFGKSAKARQNILEIITGKIKEVALAPAQKKAFEELEQIVRQVSTK